MKITRFAAAVAACLAVTPAVAATFTIDFENVPLNAAGVYLPGATTLFVSYPGLFNHDFADFGGGCCWSGWTVSNQTDTTTAGFGNQYSAYTGGGEGGSAQYGLAYLGSPTITFDTPTIVSAASFANTTYAALSMLQGDGFAKKFGGASGNDADFLTLTVEGRNTRGEITGTVVVTLADYRFADNASDYVLEGWQRTDLTPLGVVNAVTFSMASSDTGFFGINTPTYFAIDDITVAAVPEPGTTALVALGLGIVAAGAFRRR
jgi:hypothetical protein